MPPAEKKPERRFKIHGNYIYIVATKGKNVAAMYFFKKKKREKGGVLCLLLTALILFEFLGIKTEANGAEPPSLYATAAVLMDADTGRVLYEKNGDVFMSNASTTKILTCIVALENASPEEIVEVSSYAAGMPKVKLFMNPGEHFKLGDLLYSLMLESHNDSAVAIAEHVGGSMEGFAAMMNEKAAWLGCKNSWFITPNGLDATQTFQGEDGESILREHGTCAEDLARIMAYCAFYSPAKEEFLKITRTENYSFASEEGRSFSCVNHNAFLHMMEGALTGKTGFTNKAGYCYVAALERDGKRFTIALLACGWPGNKTWKWADSKELFTYGRENFVYHTIEEAAINDKVFLPIPVENGQTDRIGGAAYTEVEIKQGSGIYGLLLSESEKIEVSWETEESLQAPVAQGETVGYIRYMTGGVCLREDLVVTRSAVEKIDFFWCFKRVLEKYIL